MRFSRHATGQERTRRSEDMESIIEPFELHGLDQFSRRLGLK